MKLASFAILVPNFYTVRAFSLGAPLPRAFWRSTIFASSYFKVSSTFTTIYSICCLLGPLTLSFSNKFFMSAYCEVSRLRSLCMNSKSSSLLISTSSTWLFYLGTSKAFRISISSGFVYSKIASRIPCLIKKRQS
jgi:hypothetical protein